MERFDSGKLKVVHHSLLVRDLMGAYTPLLTVPTAACLLVEAKTKLCACGMQALVNASGYCEVIQTEYGRLLSAPITGCLQVAVMTKPCVCGMSVQVNASKFYTVTRIEFGRLPSALMVRCLLVAAMKTKAYACGM